HFQKKEPDKFKQEFHRVDVDFQNANSNPIIEEIEETNLYFNYYGGNKEGFSNVKSYRKIIYKNLYPKIDLEFFVPEDISKPVEYNFLIHSGGNISDIKMKISGAKTTLKE